MAVTRGKDARLDFRLRKDAKETIELAARITGQSLSEFAVSTLVQSAMETIAKHDTTRLSNRDRGLFLALLDADAEPNQALKQAAERYRNSGR